MRRTINFITSKMLKASLIIFIIIIVVIFRPLPVFADDASASSDLQSKLNQLKAEIASKAAAIKSQVDQKIENKAIAGLVQSKTDDQIILTTSDRNQTVLINKFTDYQYQGKVTKSISQDDFVVALGDIDDKGNLDAKRVVKMTQPPQDLTKYILGTVKDASASAILVTSKDGKDQGVDISKKTSYQLGEKAASLKNISQGDKVIVVGPIIPETGNVDSRFIYIFPDPNTPSPTASASATTKASKK